VGCDAAKSDITFEAITNKVSKKITAELKTSSATVLHQTNHNQHDLSQSITNGMKELKEAMMEMAQQQTEIVQYQAMASAPSSMKKEFYSMLHENLYASMTSKMQKRG
jgi:hypothetical protein